MDFHTVRMCIVDAFFHVFHRKILGIGTQAICLAADVDGIRAEMHGGFEHFKAARRNQKLRPFPFWLCITQFLFLIKDLKDLHFPVQYFSRSLLRRLRFPALL